MKNKFKNGMIFWAIALFIGWVIGRLILEYLLFILIPVPNIILGISPDPLGLLASGAIWPYLAAKRALVGMLILIVILLIESFFIHKDTLYDFSSSNDRMHSWLNRIIVGLRIALAGYMFVFGLQMESYWHILFSPNDHMLDLNVYLMDNFFLLVIIVIIGYTVVFEPWAVILKRQQKINYQRNRSTLLIICRIGVYFILNLLLLWFAYPNPNNSYLAVVTFIGVGVFWIKLNFQNRGERDSVESHNIDRM